MEERKHIIVGCGAAGLAALRQIRKAGAQDPVRVVTMEPCLPYSPTSLPYLISGRIKEPDLPVVNAAFFDDMKAELAIGSAVSRIDGKKGEVVYATGESEPYRTLLLATGSEPVLPSVPGLAEGPVLNLRTLADARGLMARMAESRTAVILGAGLIGMHLAQCLAEAGLAVSVVEALPRVLPGYFDDEAGSIIRAAFEGRGVSFHTGCRAERVEWAGKAARVFLSEGRTLAADLLVAATGVRPRAAFLEGSGVETADGILVGPRMETSVPGIFAAGDVARARGVLTGEHGLSPILPSAAEQGRVAGDNMAGGTAEYDGWLPMNTFPFFGRLAVSVGEAEAHKGDEVLAGAGEETGYGRLILRDGRLVGAAFIDRDPNGGVLQYIVRKRVEVGGLKRDLLARPGETALWLMREAERKESLSVEE